MENVKYILNETGEKVEVLIPFKDYEELVRMKQMYEEKYRILESIRCGAEEIKQDRLNNQLTEELTDFINEIEDYSH
jgi:hypothetical protein